MPPWRLAGAMLPDVILSMKRTWALLALLVLCSTALAEKRATLFVEAVNNRRVRTGLSVYSCTLRSPAYGSACKAGRNTDESLA